MDLKSYFRVRGRVPLAAAVALAAALASLLIFAYTAEQDDVKNAAVPTRWPNNTFAWSLNPATNPNVSTSGPGAVSVQQALVNAFNAWQSASMTLNRQSVQVVNLMVTGPAQTGSTGTDGSSADCLNIVSFVDTKSSDFPTGTIAATFLTTSYGTPPTNTYSCPPTAPPTPRSCPLQSCIIDADILFNPTQSFSTAQPTPASSFDIQSVATHEAGHALGLDHSGIAAAVMYPFGDTGQSQSRTLSVDDSAGIASIYPAAGPPPCPSGTTVLTCLLGGISGTVTMNGTGIFASHVVAIDTATGDAVIDGLTDTNGNYTLIGLPPATYNVLAIPLAADTNSGIYTLTDFGGWSCGYAGTTENSPPCCDPATDPTCTGTPENNPTNYTGKFY